MMIHFSNPTTGEYLSSSFADADPRNETRWLVPSNATTESPPSRTPTTWPFWRNGAWALLPDYRGRRCYSIRTGEPVEIVAAGKTPDELGLTETPRPTPRHEWINGAWTVPDSVIAEEKQANAQRQFEALMARARKANAGRADAYAAGQLDDEGAHYFREWAAYQMALVNAFERASDPEAIEWPPLPAPYGPPTAVAEQNTDTSATA